MNTRFNVKRQFNSFYFKEYEEPENKLINWKEATAFTPLVLIKDVPREVALKLKEINVNNINEYGMTTVGQMNEYLGFTVARDLRCLGRRIGWYNGVNDELRY